jgi:dolichol-phosphate mannosyltransferase
MAARRPPGERAAVILVVLPAYNEAEAMPRLLGRLRAVVPSVNQPVTCLVVDDGSKDGTADAAAREDGTVLPVEVVRHAQNRGLHGALDTGLRAALARTTADDWIVTMDADDTHPPDLIPLMIESARRHQSTVVIASRFQPGAEWHGLSWDRRLFSYTVSWMFRILWPLPNVRDYTCGYRAYRAGLLVDAYERWGAALVNEPSFACMPDVLWKVSRLKPRFSEVPLSLHYERKPGPSKMNVLRTIRRSLALLVKRRIGITG